MPDLEDPSQRSTGQSAVVMNKGSNPPVRWSVHKADMEMNFPDALKDYEDRRTGKTEDSFSEELDDLVGEERATYLEKIASKVHHTFFTMDYSHGFTGRGGKLISPCSRFVAAYLRSCSIT